MKVSLPAITDKILHDCECASNYRHKWVSIIVVAILIFASFYATAQSGEKDSSLWQPWYITPRTGAQHINLSGTWELSHMDKPINSLNDLAKRKDTFQTTVPNSVHWSLYKSGKLPHPYYNKNSDLYKWTDEKAWYYKKSFTPLAGVKDNYVFLCFDGVDYFSKVWVNDSLVGQHEGMFGGPNIEISHLLKENSNNEIVVELRAGNWGNKADEYESFPRTASGSRDLSKRTGYNPRASGRIIKPWVISGGSGGEMFFSLGMWQGVRMEVVPKTHLERPYFTTKSVTNNQALLHLSTELFVNAHSLQQSLHPWNNVQLRHPDEKGYVFKEISDELSVMIELFSGKEKAVAKEFPIKVFEGRNWLEEDMEIPNPKLWNPTGLGEPNLYDVKLSLKKAGVIIDAAEFKYGIRTIERIKSAGPRTGDRFENWQFVVNGATIFVKGMNFTPQDVLLETSEERYRWTLTAAKKMGVQLIRVWGGGLLETNTFYNLCDSLGIMVWQDFPIGNQDTPGYPQDVWEAQVVQNICRLRNHPSLVIWCGGNEFNPYSSGNAMSLGILERSLRTFDNSRLFLRTTPDGGSIHVYPDMDPTWYTRSYGKEAWISETGMHSLPEANVFYEVADTTEFVGLGKMWDKDFDKTHPQFVHHFTEYGPGRVPRMLSRASHIADMADPTLESIAEATQIGAGEFYQIVSEEVQGNYPITTGLMPWVFKRHWPVIAIQMMDWFGHAGAPYYFLKRTYEPTHVAIDLPRLLWVPGEKIDLNVNVLSSPSTGSGAYKMTVTVYDDGFKQLFKTEKLLIVKNNTAVTHISAGSFAIPPGYKDRFLFLLTQLQDASGKLVSQSYYYPRSLVKMEDKSFYEKYTSEPIPWVAFDNGPWLKPVVSKTATAVSLKMIADKKIHQNESELKLMIKNEGKLPAFMTKVDITGVKRAFVASDNYLWLQPGEIKEITMNVLWREEKENAVINVQAWNAPNIQIKLSNN